MISLAVFALATISLTAGMNLAPWLYRLVPPVPLVLVSGFASAAGLWLTATAGGFAQLAVGYGLLFGLGGLLAQGCDLVVGDDDLRVDAVGIAVVVDHLVEVDLVQDLWLELGDLAHRAQQSINTLSRHRTLCLCQHRDELDVELHALHGLGRRWQHVGPHQVVERGVDQWLQQLVVQALEHGAQHQQLFLVALGHLGRRDA